MHNSDFEVSVIDDFHKRYYIDMLATVNTGAEARRVLKNFIELLLKIKQLNTNYQIVVAGKNIKSSSNGINELMNELVEKSMGIF